VYSPIGCGAADFWNALVQGCTGAAIVTGFETTDLPRNKACQVKQPLSNKNPPCGRASRLAIAAMQQAFENSALNACKLQSARVATIVGTTMGETEFIENRLDAPKEEWLSKEHVREIISGSPGCISRNAATYCGIDPHDSLDL